MKTYRILRPAVAMIELIFAIVIMGIVMMSAPMMISTATQSGYVVIQQEGINEAATQMNIILGYPWDENNSDEDYAPSVLNVTAGDANLDGADDGISHKRRAGTPDISKRLYITGNNAEFDASAIGADAGDLDDMDDFHNTSVTLQLEGGTTSDSDYIESDITIARTVTYLSDNITSGTYATPNGSNAINFTPAFAAVAPAGTSNIKHIQVTLTSTSDIAELNSTNITLHAFSCNIGSYELGEK